MHTVPEAARILGLAASTLRLQIKRGKLTAHRFGRAWVITTAEIERYRVEHLREKVA